MEQFSLKGKVALVTGGNRGLGRAIALALAEAGANVAIVSRTGEGLTDAAEEIRALGAQSLSLTGDVAVPSEVKRIVKAVVDRFGRLDVLVNAAGVNRRIPSLEVSESDWNWILGVNLKGNFFTCAKPLGG